MCCSIKKALKNAFFFATTHRAIIYGNRVETSKPYLRIYMSSVLNLLPKLSRLRLFVNREQTKV